MTALVLGLAGSFPLALWVGGGSTQKRYCPQATMLSEGDTPPTSLTLLVTFLLPQTGAAKCGTW